MIPGSGTGSLTTIPERGAREWCVFPVEPRGKKPWGGLPWSEMSRPRSEWGDRWPKDEVNLGIDCGRSGLVVIDEDEPGAVEAALGDLPPTYTVRTGKGRHLYFRANGRPVRNHTRFWRGVDVRADGGYVVGPGSIHPSGDPYEVVEDIEVAVLPAAVERALCGDEEVEIDLSDHRAPFALPEVIETGSRNDTLFRYACSLVARGLRDTERLDLLRLAYQRCEEPYTDESPEDLLSRALREYGETEHERRTRWHLQTMRAQRDARVLLKEEEQAASGLPTAADLMLPGGSLVLDSPELPSPVWGHGGMVLMAEGESLMILGGAGSGKTTLAQQWALGRCGLSGFADLLGLPVTPGEGRTLYLAMDRPRQAVRSLRRMIGDDDREHLDESLRVHLGPPPVNLTEHPDALVKLCTDAGADSVVVDSLKDAGSVVDDEGGTGWNAARQRALVAGVAVLELHHPRKGLAGSVPSLEDTYGSTWLTAGAGSVLALAGRPGDALVKAAHLKQPAEVVGPLKVLHDHERGRSMVWDEADLPGLAARPEGVTALEAAQAIYETDKPEANQKEAARRRLAALARAGSLRVLDKGDRGASRPARWGAVGVSE